MRNRYWKNENGKWFWHKSEDEDIGPFSSRKIAKNNYAKHCEENAQIKIIGRVKEK